ncbi:MAG: TonB-dependent receptor [Cyclobacteriaceae bacterium]
MFKFMMAAIGCSLSLNAWAQFSVSGTVEDRATNEVLVGATVQLKNQKKFSVTDEQGRFEIKGISGQQTLLIKFLGYQDHQVEVNVSGDIQLEIVAEENSQLTDEVVVMATRATEKSATTFTNVSKATIQKQNFGQDLPFVLNWTPSLVTTSDAGAGVGYTGLRIRGSDATRINVTINGIPLNESDEQGVFWVDVPDIATSAQSIQIQRGVGTSTNGAGAFGASINLQTNARHDKPYVDLINTYGSFNTHRHTIGLGTGLIKKFTFDGRLSLIKSDGFIDRASSDLNSYYLAGGYYGDKTIVKAIVFGGQEITYQSWYGVPQSRLNNDVTAMQETAAAEGWNTEQIANLLNSNSRTFNSYTYKNQVDNYRQDHYQLHTSHRFNNYLTANAALHYTKGGGYYEELKYNAAFKKYGLDTVVIGADKIGSSDLVRRRWLQTNFYGVTYSINFEKGKFNSILGGAINRHQADRFGEIISSTNAENILKGHRYYFNEGDKRDFNVFWKTEYRLIDFLTYFIDLQYRRVDYSANGMDNDQTPFNFNVNYDFFNPKIGFAYLIKPNQQFYTSYSIANREPVRSDFVDAIAGNIPKQESLKNLEAGYRIRKNNNALNINFYFMSYQNQLVPTGKLNDVGAAIRTNVEKSYRTGIEIDGGIRFNEKLTWNANLTLSQNRIAKFTEVLYDYGVNYDQYNEVRKDQTNTDISFSPSVISGSNILYHPIKNIEVGLLTKFVGKQYLDNTSNEKRKIDSYFINDLRLTYTCKPTFLRELSISFLINNIFDVTYSSNGYTWGYLAGLAETRQNYYYPQAGRNFLAMVAVRF